MEFVKESRNQEMKMPELEKKLAGWSKILHDKSKNNEITGVVERDKNPTERKYAEGAGKIMSY